MRIEIRLKPGKKESRVVKLDFAIYEVWVKSPPIKGAANKEMLQVLTKYFKRKRSDFRIVKGLTSPLKIVEMTE